jgi:hypothetical protein
MKTRNKPKTTLATNVVDYMNSSYIVLYLHAGHHMKKLYIFSFHAVRIIIIIIIIMLLKTVTCLVDSKRYVVIIIFPDILLVI